jgi:hypothetical protein
MPRASQIRSLDVTRRDGGDQPVSGLLELMRRVLGKGSQVEAPGERLAQSARDEHPAPGIAAFEHEGERAPGAQLGGPPFEGRAGHTLPLDEEAQIQEVVRLEAPVLGTPGPVQEKADRRGVDRVRHTDPRALPFDLPGAGQDRTSQSPLMPREGERAVDDVPLHVQLRVPSRSPEGVSIMAERRGRILRIREPGPPQLACDRRRST